MSKVRLIRQGDVPLILLDSKPEPRSHLTETNKKVIRKGEHGGVHKLADTSKAVIVEDRGLENQLFGTYVHVLEPTELVHTTSHRPLPLEPGWYEVREQREWIGNESRRVQD